VEDSLNLIEEMTHKFWNLNQSYENNPVVFFNLDKFTAKIPVSPLSAHFPDLQTKESFTAFNFFRRQLQNRKHQWHKEDFLVFELANFEEANSRDVMAGLIRHFATRLVKF